jgi:hypothetical protein
VQADGGLLIVSQFDGHRSSLTLIMMCASPVGVGIIELNERPDGDPNISDSPPTASTPPQIVQMEMDDERGVLMVQGHRSTRPAGLKPALEYEQTGVPRLHDLDSQILRGSKEEQKTPRDTI